MFKITYLGHAGWLCETENLKCVFDPWACDSGAFFDSWYPFPDNSNIDFEKILSDLDFIYISHAHEDHLVEETLKLADKDTKIIISKFNEKSTLSKLSSLGFTNIQEISCNQKIKVKDVKVSLLKSEGRMENDSCILIEKDKFKLLNLNDCHVDFQKLKNFSGEVDVLLIQSSNAIWWPCNYEYEDNIKKEFGNLKRKNLLNRSLKYSEQLSAKLTIPNAGPPIFKNKEMDRWNFKRNENWNPFCTSKEAADFFNNNNKVSEFMVPGETVEISHEMKVNKNENLRNLIYGNLENYTKEYLKRIRSQKGQTFLQEDTANKFIKKFIRQVKTLSKISNVYINKIDFKVLFEFGPSEKWVMDFQNKLNPIEQFAGQECRYHFTINKNYLPLLFSNKEVDFERLFLSGDFSCKREPDVFNEFLFVILKNFDTKRFLISEKTYAENNKMEDEFFVLNHKGCSYEVQKFCPHMFADLEEVGYVNDSGKFVCPLHGWEFDLITGVCEGKKEKLKINKKK